MAVGAVAGLFMLLSGCAANPSSGREQIDSLAVDYTIEASGIVHAVEKIDYDFGANSGKHGIDRFLASRFASNDGNERVYRYSDVSATSPSGASALFSTTLSNALQIRIGNTNATTGGKQSYVISYDIAGAIDNPTLEGGTSIDEFYWNVTGNYWQVPIEKTTVTLHGPTATSQIACYMGTQGSTARCDDSTSADAVAHFSQGRLFPGEGLTIDVAWPDGTFQNTAPIIERPLSAGAPPVTSGSNDGPNPFWSPWNWGVGLVLLVGIPLGFRLFVWLRRRDLEFVGVTPGSIPEDPHTAPTRKAPLDETVVVAYQPPDGLPVGAANTILTKSRKTIDTTATLVDLAVRGHLRIEEIGGKSGRKPSNYRLTATPDVAIEKKSAALLPHEALLLAKLFAAGRTTVTLSDLRNTFASSIRTIGRSLDAWIQSGGFVLDKLDRRHPLVSLILVGSIIAFIVVNFLSLPWTLIPIGSLVGGLLASRWSKKAIRRSALGHAYYLQLEGFRLYISTAEADRIRFDEQDDVFSRYMPWAIAFGEAERWARVFAELAEHGKVSEVPQWYVSNGGFATGALAGSLASISSIGSAVTSFSALASSAMASTPASSGRSGFSGGSSGGFSGGGGGGGGGGSW